MIRFFAKEAQNDKLGWIAVFNLAKVRWWVAYSRD
jgi:hypothetical protein